MSPLTSWGGMAPLAPPLKSASVTLVFTGRMLFLMPNENCPSTEGISPSQCWVSLPDSSQRKCERTPLDWVSGSHCSTLTDKFPEYDTANRLLVWADAERKQSYKCTTCPVSHQRRSLASSYTYWNGWRSYSELSQNQWDLLYKVTRR